MKNLKTVYIIDDNPIDCLVAETVIRKEIASVKIKVFSEAETALEELSKNFRKESKEIPELILVDLAMPITDGYGFLERYSQLQSNHSPVVYALTAFINEKYLSKAKRYACVENVLIKPFTKAIFRAIREESFR